MATLLLYGFDKILGSMRLGLFQRLLQHVNNVRQIGGIGLQQHLLRAALLRRI